LLALDPHPAIHVVHKHDPRTLALQEHLEGAHFGQDFVAGKGVWMRQIALLRVRKHFHAENEKAPQPLSDNTRSGSEVWSRAFEQNTASKNSPGNGIASPKPCRTSIPSGYR
jgi:hypothetical protein